MKMLSNIQKYIFPSPYLFTMTFPYHSLIYRLQLLQDITLTSRKHGWSYQDITRYHPEFNQEVYYYATPLSNISMDFKNIIMKMRLLADITMVSILIYSKVTVYIIF